MPAGPHTGAQPRSMRLGEADPSTGTTKMSQSPAALWAAYASRVLTFRDGRLLSDERVAAPRDAAEALAALPEEVLA